MTRTHDVVGRNVRRLRIARELTVSELARRGDLSRATLTELEAGRANPTLDTIETLARELGTTVSALLVASLEDQIVRVAAGTGIAKRNGAMNARLLQRTGVADALVELWHVVLDHSAQPQHAPAHPRGVIEQLYALDGELEAGPSDGPFVLSVGDLLSFPADQPHLYRSHTATSGLLIQMIYPSASPEPDLVSGGMLDNPDD